jgi:hypothetical protein
MSDLLITFTPEFKREYKKLAKRYLSLDDDMKALLIRIYENPSLGTSLGSGAFKIRLAISSKKKGKSGGARVITYYISEDAELYLLSIYDKSEQSDILDKVLKQLINRVTESKQK